MREFATMIFQIGLVVFLGLLAVMVASVVGEGPPPERTRLDRSAEALWTTDPVRVDADRQNFERVAPAEASYGPPDPYPLKMRADRRLRVTANNVFTYEGRPFRLAGVEPVERNRVCADTQGRRYSCGLNAFKALDNAVRGKLLECRVVEETEEDRAVECLLNGRDLVQSL